MSNSRWVAVKNANSVGVLIGALAVAALVVALVILFGGLLTMLGFALVAAVFPVVPALGFGSSVLLFTGVYILLQLIRGALS